MLKELLFLPEHFKLLLLSTLVICSLLTALGQPRPCIVLLLCQLLLCLGDLRPHLLVTLMDLLLPGKLALEHFLSLAELRHERLAVFLLLDQFRLNGLLESVYDFQSGRLQPPCFEGFPECAHTACLVAGEHLHTKVALHL